MNGMRGRAFVVLNAQRSDDGISIVLKATHLQTLVNAERASITMTVEGAVTAYYASSQLKKLFGVGEGEQKTTKPLKQ
jgi:acetolactate synthase regulatory subunit